MAVRAAPVLFGAAVIVNATPPVPDTGEIETQSTGLNTDHGQAAANVINVKD